MIHLVWIGIALLALFLFVRKESKREADLDPTIRKAIENAVVDKDIPLVGGRGPFVDMTRVQAGRKSK